MTKKKTKHTRRKDGRIVMKKVIDGEPKYFYGHSDEEVEQKYYDYKAALEAGEVNPPRTFKEVADAWWEEKESQLSPNTVAGFRVGKMAAVDTFGPQPVTKISPRDVIAYLQRYAAQGYSQKTIANRKTVLKGILDYAFISGDIDRNPCVDIPIIKGKAKTPREPAPDADIRLIEQHKTDSTIARMYYFLLFSGLRRGEAIALQQKHIDRKKKTVLVEQSCAWSNSRPVIKTPKTSAGVRTISLTDNVIEVLPTGKPDDYVFFPDGLPSRQMFVRAMNKYRERTGVTATPHQLRHSYASLLHSAGIDVKDAQTMLGHSSILLTQDIYTHLEEQHKKEVQKKLNRYIKKTRKLS